MPVGIVKRQYSPSPASFNSLIKLRMLLRCCFILRHHDTETLFMLYLCPCLDLQLFTKVLRQTLVFMWNRALWEKFRFLFFRRFLLMLAGLSFLGEEKALGNNSSLKFWSVRSISKFHKILNLKSLEYTWGNSYSQFYY